MQCFIQNWDFEGGISVGFGGGGGGIGFGGISSLNALDKTLDTRVIAGSVCMINYIMNRQDKFCE